MFMLLAHTHFAAAAATDASNQRVLKRWLGQNVETHPAVRAARASLDAASYQMVAADKALYNPELELDAENAETRVRSIGLSQTIDWGDTRGART
ncbi:MAG TPA: TolC family protein, partial [Thiotrichales bacterium]|nr:TolC family protein [Thiotrichales bacterium]